MKIPARMSFADCARRAALAHGRVRHPVASRRRPIRGRSMFKGSEFDRLSLDWVATLQPADDEIRWEMLRLRARARDLARNSPYVRQYLNLMAVNVIGPHGPRMQSQVRNNDRTLSDLLNGKIEEAWKAWAAAPTIDGKGSLVDFQHQCIKAVAREGEAFVRLHRGYPNEWGLALEAIDADLVDEAMNRPAGFNGPEIRLGVEVDRDGRPLAYHAWSAPASVLNARADRDRIRLPASDVLHLYDPDRIGQTRGVTWLAPVMFALKQLDGYDEAELVASRIHASAMGVLTRKEGAGEFTTDENDKIEIEANPGSFVFAPEGYGLETWAPQHPGENYADFVKGALRRIASGLGLSYNVLANDLEGVNYSSMRSGMLIERDTWRRLQEWWSRSFLNPIYAAWLGQALLAGGLVLDSRDMRRFLAVRWTPRGWPWVDPLKDIEAGIQGIQAGLTSRSDLLAEEGRDVEETLERLADEERMAREKGVDISGPKPAGAAQPEMNEVERNGTGRLGRLLADAR